MTWTPTTLRSGRLLFLLDLRLGETVLRVATEPASAPTGPSGESYAYRGGLDLDKSLEDRLDLFADAAAARQVAVGIWLDGLQDIVALESLGHRLAAATGRLMVWPETGDASDVVVWLDGPVIEPEYETAEQIIEFSLTEEDADAQGRIPDESALYMESTWSALLVGDVEKMGERYPIIIGEPGLAGDLDGSAVVHVHRERLLLAGHPVDASDVTIYDETTGTTYVEAVVHQEDSLGRTVAVVDTTTEPALQVLGQSYWTRWDTGGGLKVDGALLDSAGDLLRWMLQRSGARWDAGRVAAALPRLNQYAIDCYIGASPDERVSPLEWIREHLSPILPISMRRGPEGLFPVVWRFDAITSDAVERINADDSRAWRDGPVSWSSRDRVANELVLKYARSARTDKTTLRLGLTGDPVRAALDTDLKMSLACRYSSALFGVRPKTLSTKVVDDTATAGRILFWLAARFALPTRAAKYLCDLSLGHLEPGDVVLLDDSEAGFASQVCLVEGVTWRSADLALLLRTVETPGILRS